MDSERAEELLCRIEELTGQLAAAHPELAADVFRSDESDLEYARRRMRELGIVGTGHALPEPLRNVGFGGDVTCQSETNRQTMDDERRSREMTAEDRRALATDYSKGEVNREEAAQFQSLLR